MTVLGTRIDPSSAQALANDTANREIAADLHARLAVAAQGGPERSRSRHVERGKLLPRQRVDHLLDPGSPFLELSPLAATGMYDDEAPAAGIITGVGRINERLCMVDRQRRHRQGRHLLPDDGEEAPARAGGRGAEPAAVHLLWSTPAGRSCRCRRMCSPTASTSDASSTTRRACPRSRHPADRRGDGVMHRRAAPTCPP
ncbi:MAG: carboxyl transferase domain-containing protein [Candidatus Nanopelagicales bacterium]